MRLYVRSVRGTTDGAGRMREITLAHTGPNGQLLSPALLGNEWTIVTRDAAILADVQDGDFADIELTVVKAEDALIQR